MPILGTDEPVVGGDPGPESGTSTLGVPAFQEVKVLTLCAPFHRARPEDASALAELVNMAGEGMPLYLWEKLAGRGETPLDVGCRRAERDTGSFSYRNAIVAVCDGRVVSCLVGYRLPDESPGIGPAKTPPMIVPMQELENLAPSTWYVNFLATLPSYRRRGYGTRLLSIADELATDSRATGVSIIVSDANTSARRLYERCGFRFVAARRMVKECWENEGENWILLGKPSPAAEG